MGMNWNASKMPLFGQMFKNPAEEFQQNQFQESARAMQAYRPEEAQARQNALQQTYSLFQPTNRAIGQMYGAGSMFDTGAATQNPMSERMQGLGKPKGTRDEWMRPGYEQGYSGEWGSPADAYEKGKRGR
jgi:hypothetical protein